VIDLHTHILPGLDHGARDWEEAVAMGRIAAADGVTVIAATPHVNEVYPNAQGPVREAVAELRLRLAAAGVDLAVVVGGDYHIRPDLGRENVVTLGDNGRYFLLELPSHVLPPRVDAFVGGLVARGLVPIVTHPERCLVLQHNRRRLEPLLEKGAIAQITAGSLLGHFGAPAAACAREYLTRGWVHLLASDAHWADERPPGLSEGVRAAARLVGEAAARALVVDNPGAVLEGRALPSAGNHK
jgi:protein-tyrosine phosphatase